MIDILQTNRVAIYQDKAITAYYKTAPFHPSEDYPEYPFHGKISQNTNKVYEAVRNAFILFDLDRENIGKPVWNPLKDIIKPGQKVVIKPNFVLDKHYNNGTIECVITQADVLRAVCDYVYIALGGKGEMVIADAPQANCNFDNLLNITQVKSIGAFYKAETGFDIPVYDLRQLRLRTFIDASSRVVEDGDPLGYTIVDMGKNSSFINLANMDKIYGADYDRKETVKHHNQDKHEYCVSRTILSADVIISVPKMKVHRKAGVTLNLKNLIGINGNKNYLPHYRIGLPEDGGDEFPGLNSAQKKVMYSNRKLSDLFLAKPSIVRVTIYKMIWFCYRFFFKIFPQSDIRNIVMAGDWSGNDTIWRTVLDLNKILLYADADGILHNTPQRGFFSIIDGIIAGENEGPLIPTEKPCGIIACGANPLVVDMAVARVMGFPVGKIPKFVQALLLEQYVLSRVKPDEVEIKSNINDYSHALRNEKETYLAFKPARGWIKAVE